jgi:hypothetical protein
MNTNIMSLYNVPSSDAVFSIHYHVIKFVTDLRDVNGFLRILRFPNTTKIDHHDIAEILLQVVLIIITPNHLFFEEGLHRCNDAASAIIPLESDNSQ